MRWADATRVATSSMRATGVDGQYLESVQHRRLATLLRHARVRSPFFRRHLSGLPDDFDDLTLVSPTSKSELMADFDAWVTDPRLRFDRLQEEFVSRPELVGHRYLRRYRVWTTSGTTGSPAVLIQDPSSWLVFQLVSRLRVERQLFRHGAISGLMTQGLRSAVLVATGGHYGGVGVAAAVQQLHPTLGRRVRVVSVLLPIAEQVRRLNEFQPSYVSGYPSAMIELAREQQLGRLHIEPILLMCAGEHLGDKQREILESTFGCHVLQGYAASEVPGLALECDEHRFHLNADWYLLEPVDKDGNVVEPGVSSHSTLVTNLANFVQPIIRYDLGDRVRLHADPCPCGSRLPSMDVEGRTNDVVTLETVAGTETRIVPLALGSVIEETLGVRRFQVLNPDASTLMVRLDVATRFERGRVWNELEPRLRSFLTDQGVGNVSLSLADEAPQAESAGGKLRQVVRTLQAA